MATTAATPSPLLITSPRSKPFADKAGDEGSGEIGLDKLEASSRDRYLLEEASIGGDKSYVELMTYWPVLPQRLSHIEFAK